VSEQSLTYNLTQNESVWTEDCTGIDNQTYNYTKQNKKNSS